MISGLFWNSERILKWTQISILSASPDLINEVYSDCTCSMSKIKFDSVIHRNVIWYGLQRERMPINRGLGRPRLFTQLPRWSLIAMASQRAKLGKAIKSATSTREHPINGNADVWISRIVVPRGGNPFHNK